MDHYRFSESTHRNNSNESGRLIINRQVLTEIQSYLDGRIDAPAVLLAGPAGCGKTTVCEQVAAVNAMTLEDMKSAHQGKMSYHPVQRRPVLLVVDEAETMKAAELRSILQRREKKILVAHEAWKMPQMVKNQCHIIKMPRPRKFEYKQFIKEKGLETPANLDEFRSWHDMISWQYGGTIGETDIISDFEQARLIFSGKMHQRPTISLNRLLWYYVSNGGDPEVVKIINGLQGPMAQRAGMDILCMQRIDIGWKKKKVEKFEFRGFK